MSIDELRDKTIGILGYGMEGQSVAGFLDENKIQYKVFDKKDDEKYLENAVASCQVLFRSPGVKVLEPVLVNAKNQGVVITSQIKFFFENCPAKIIGVTGSKGKGTTSKLIYDILQSAKVSSYLAGNIGASAIDLLPKLQSEDYVVLELSSFQLQDLDMSPHIAVVLMVVPEHFDYHAGMEEYLEAKANILKYQKDTDFAVINQDFEGSMKIGKAGAAKKYYVQTLPEEKVEHDPFKIYNPEDHVTIKNGVFAEQLHGGVYLVENGHLNKFMDITNSPLRGFHNVQNISAAIMVTKILEIKDAVIQQTIENYKGLEHRLEFVTEKKRIKFYNDSIGTTPESSVAAISAFIEPEIVIVGGADKKVDYKQFAAELSKHKNIKNLILIGNIAADLEKYLKDLGWADKVISGSQNMSEIFERIKKIAQPGDVVLLAPGTSSFGMFKDYKDRGNQFKELALQFDDQA